MPLIFLTLAPGVELNHFYSMVPVTGAALLLQKLMGVKPPESGLWAYFLPVLAPMIVYCWIALRWAIEQFQREEVLFREAERLELKLWLRRIFREKEALPSVGQALFCFALIFGLHWLTVGSGSRVSPLSSHAVRYLAFVATPPLFMVLLLTTRPLDGLALRWPPWWTWPIAILLAVLLLPPFSALTLLLLDQFPHIKQALHDSEELLGQTARLSRLTTGRFSGVFFLFVFVILPSLCEELAFRGFILSGLRQRLRPWTAIFLSSLLYALYQMNVLQALPHFLLGIVLALLVQRGGSIAGAIVFRLVWESLLWSPLLMREGFSIAAWINGGVVIVCLLLAAPLLAMLRPPSANREPMASPPISSYPESA
jgi:sodium transport system permease protein